MNRALRVAGVFLCLVVVVYGIQGLFLGSTSPSGVAQTVQSAITNSVGFAKLHVTGGIGVNVFADAASGLPEINNLVAGSPAAMAGLREGDRILEIDGVATHGRTLAQNIESIRGFAIGSVGLTIQRAGSTNLNFVIHRSSWSSMSAGLAEHKKALQDVSRFREVQAVTNLPQAVIALCADHRGRLAEPGQKWQVTDAIIDDTLPRKRLVWAVTDGDYYVVHYESGGMGHGYHALVVRLKKGADKPSFLWHGVGRNLKDFKAFLDAVEGNKLDDSLVR